MIQTENEYNDWMTAEHNMGTTIIAVEYDQGVILGADSRTTTGSYVFNRFADKITNIADRIWVCRSGSSADTQAISEYVRYFLEAHSIELDQPPSVETAAYMTQKICYDYKDQFLAGMIVAGWDTIKGGQVYQIPLGGLLYRGVYAISGSGSTYITGFCDKNFQKNMNEQQTTNLIVEALSLAMLRDGSSGGLVRIVVVNKNGSRKFMVPGNDLPHSSFL